MKSGVEKKSNIAKWLVIGAVIVIFILVFQPQIGRFLDRIIEEIISSGVDESTQGGFLVFYNPSYGNKIYQFQRIAIDSGRAYVVTASQLPPDDQLSQQTREELRKILNSFRLII